jgi:hypothetical protein
VEVAEVEVALSALQVLALQRAELTAHHMPKMFRSYWAEAMKKVHGREDTIVLGNMCQEAETAFDSVTSMHFLEIPATS